MSANTPRSARNDHRVPVLLALGLLFFALGPAWTASDRPEQEAAGEPPRAIHLWLTAPGREQGLYRLLPGPSSILTWAELGNRLRFQPPPGQAAAPVPLYASLELSRSGPAMASGLPPRTAPFFFQPIPLNQADQELLATLPGLGPALAGRIVAYRRERGQFHALSELLNIKGIGSVKFNTLTPYLTVSGSEE